MGPNIVTETHTSHSSSIVPKSQAAGQLMQVSGSSIATRSLQGQSNRLKQASHPGQESTLRERSNSSQIVIGGGPERKRPKRGLHHD
jgi:hypothetical protein